MINTLRLGYIRGSYANVVPARSPMRGQKNVKLY